MIHEGDLNKDIVGDSVDILLASRVHASQTIDGWAISPPSTCVWR